MKFGKFLSEKRSDILDRCFNAIADTYPADTPIFLKTKKDEFANPVGTHARCGIEGIFDELLNSIDSGSELDAGRVSPFLDKIIRIRAVQEFTASQAVSFLFALKKIIREKMSAGVREGMSEAVLKEGLSAIDDRIDVLVLIAFDIYMQCREKIYDLKANETKRLTYRLLQRANLVREYESEPELMGINNINLKRKEVIK